MELYPHIDVNRFDSNNEGKIDLEERKKLLDALKEAEGAETLLTWLYNSDHTIDELYQVVRREDSPPENSGLSVIYFRQKQLRVCFL